MYEGVLDRMRSGGLFHLEVDDYMSAQLPHVQQAVDDARQQLAHRSTPAFRQMHSIHTGFAVPTAVTETPYKLHTLKQYAGQRNPGNYRLLSYLNWAEYDDNQIGHMHDVLDSFIGDHPEVPFAYFEGEIELPLAAGGLRKLVSDTLLVHSANRGTRDILIVGQDADLDSMSPHCVHDYGDRFTAPRDSPVTAIIPHSKYRRTATLPNMDSVVEWTDDWAVSKKIFSYYEPGPGFSARAMMAVMGYEPSDVLLETHNLLTRIHRGKGVEASPTCLWVPEIQVVMSPRRLYEKMHMGTEPFWSTDDPMTPRDAYRWLGDARFNRWPDISEHHRDERIRDYMRTWLRLYVTHRGVCSTAAALEKGAAYLETARQRLGGPEGAAAQIARDLLDELVSPPGGTSGA